MKKYALLIAVAALAACQGSDAPDETATEVADANPAAEMAGTYDAVAVDGTKTTTQISADGTYIDSVNGEVSDTGTWTLADGKTCFVSAAQGSEARCYTDSEPDEHGSFTATPDGGGDPLTIRKIS